jgi:hypothetical protein
MDKAKLSPWIAHIRSLWWLLTPGICQDEGMVADPGGEVYARYRIQIWSRSGPM